MIILNNKHKIVEFNSTLHIYCLLSIFRNMPSIYYTGTGAKGWRSKFKRLSDNTVKFYMLPPIKYPDGMYIYVLCKCYYFFSLMQNQSEIGGHYWFDLIYCV